MLPLITAKEFFSMTNLESKQPIPSEIKGGQDPATPDGWGIGSSPKTIPFAIMGIKGFCAVDTQFK